MSAAGAVTLLSHLPVMKSRGARCFFLVSAGVTLLLLLWTSDLGLNPMRVALAPIFLYLFVEPDRTAAMAMLLSLAVAALVSPRTSFMPLLRWVGEHPRLIALATTIVTAIGCLTLYHRHPLSMDEYVALFQSRIFAAGRLHGEFPPQLIDWLVPPEFQNYFLIASKDTGAVASLYWPAHALVMAPFTLIGAPWLCNPVITGLSVLAMHRLALRMFDSVEGAGLALLLSVASPVFFVNGMSFYAMPAHLLANCVFALLMLSPTRVRAFVAGVVGSIALTLHNPVPHILFALPVLLYSITRPGGLRLIVPLAAGYLPLSLLLGVGWFWLSGELSRVGADAEAVGLSRISMAFALPTKAVLMARVIGVAKVWLWATPGLIVLAIAGAYRWRRHPMCKLLVISAALTLFGFLFVPVDQGHGWGFRYFHSAWLVLPVLAAGALFGEPPGPSDSSLFCDAKTRSLVVVCTLLALASALPLRGYQVEAVISEQLAQLPAVAAGTERHVVLIDPTATYYGADLVQNDPFLRDATIRMLSRGEQADAQMLHGNFPDMSEQYRGRYGSVWATSPAAVSTRPEPRSEAN